MIKAIKAAFRRRAARREELGFGPCWVKVK